MEGFDVNPLFIYMQDNKCKLIVRNKSTKTPQNDKTPSCIVDFIHLNCITNFNHHFMFYNQERKLMMCNLSLAKFGKL